MSYYDELMDEMDCAVFSGEMLETNLEDFEEFVERWQRAIDQQKKTIEVEV